MGWGCAAGVSVKINDQYLNDMLLKDEAISQIFEESLDFLRKNEVIIPKDIGEPLFFKTLAYYAQFTGYQLTYNTIREYIVDEYCLISSPFEAFEFMVSIAYLSTKFPDSEVLAGIGDAGIFWLDLKFKNGSLLETETMLEYHINDIEDVDAFICTRKEIEDFFSTSIMLRLECDKYWEIKKIGNKLRGGNAGKDILSVGMAYCGKMYKETKYHEMSLEEQEMAEEFEDELWDHILKALKESDNLNSDKEFLLELVKHIQKSYIQFVSFGSDCIDFISEIIKNISKELREDKKFMKEMLKIDGWEVFCYAGELRFDRDFLLESIAYCRKMYEEVKKDEMGSLTLANPEVFGRVLWGHILKALRKSDDLKSDKEFLLELFKHIQKLYNVSCDISDYLTLEIFCFVDFSSEIVENISQELREDKQFMKEVIKINGPTKLTSTLLFESFFFCLRWRVELR